MNNIDFERRMRRLLAAAMVGAGLAGPVPAQENALGVSVQGLLDYART